ncbi:OmpP1/FadL family transporter [Segatella oulorum]|uniref:OmpP1/FadL family transporter n=1 Tax=Segatella oulorum TaxID=28136 RepID=UPI0023F0FECB|nr:hemin receptor [Segatella oulorum]
MERIYLTVASLAFTSFVAVAQETYENTKLIDNDLNGTARYVGMGGAMEALGADLSTIGTNPAGLGLFRKGKADFSFGLVNQTGMNKFNSLSKTNMSFDQIGVVFNLSKTPNASFNIGFNYHKSRNFDQLLNAANTLNNASQNKLTYQKYRNQVFKERKDLTYSQLDALYMDNLLYDNRTKKYYNFPATGYLYNQENKGYIGEYDMNLSANLNDRVYLGLTMGIHDVHYKGYAEYTENFVPNANNIPGLTLNDSREITGTGFDVKLGAIVRPMAESPFRLGAYIHTPVWYDLTTSNYTVLTDGTARPNVGETYDFRVNTPWKFGLSAGTTLADRIALGATYEYAAYNAMQTRIKDGGTYDWYYGTYYESSHNDRAMNNHTEDALKGQHTLKLGAEARITDHFSLRAGYNYLSALYKDAAVKDGSLNSPGTYYASSTSYVNWKDTNRFTFGLGWNVWRFNIDLAYQYSQQNGTFYPFMNYHEGSAPSVEDNIANPTQVNNKQHQLLLTMGYKF